jgi:hypothetical protein
MRKWPDNHFSFYLCCRLRYRQGRTRRNPVQNTDRLQCFSLYHIVQFHLLQRFQPHWVWVELVATSRKWLRGLDDQSSSIKSIAAKTSRAKLLTTERSAVEGGRGQAAAVAFVKWVSQDGDGESLDTDIYGWTDPKPVVSISFFFIKKSCTNLPLQQNPPDLNERTDLNERIIKHLLRIQPNSNLSAANASSAYSSEIIRYLLEKQVVCSAMIEASGGLLGALRVRNDFLIFNPMLIVSFSDSSLRRFWFWRMVFRNDTQNTNIRPPQKKNTMQSNHVFLSTADMILVYAMHKIGPNLFRIKKGLKKIDKITLL